MATDSMRALIDLVFNDSDMIEALQDVIQFKQTMISKFSRDDFEILDEAGFQFSSTYITQRRNELKTFLQQHPECRSNDFETLIDKITYYCTKQGQALRELKQKRTQRARQLAEANKRRAAPAASAASKKSEAPPKKNKEDENDDIDFESFHEDDE